MAIACPSIDKAAKATKAAPAKAAKAAPAKAGKAPAKGKKK